MSRLLPIEFLLTPEPQLEIKSTHQTMITEFPDILKNRLAYGCWRLADNGEDVGRRALFAALDSGYRLFDHADIYGNGQAEIIFGNAIKESTALKETSIVATKCGVRKAGDSDPSAPYRYDQSKEYIIKSCENSLRRLQLETIDLYQLHRIDHLGEPEEVAAAFDQLRDQGKVRYFGVSNASPQQFELYQSCCSQKLISNQVEISLLQTQRLEDGTLSYCLQNHVTPMAWSPLAAGKLTGDVRRVLGHQECYDPAGVAEVLLDISAAYQVTSADLAIAWLLRHPSKIIPIVGSITPDRIKSLRKALDVNLSREEWYRLLAGARGNSLP